MEISWNPYRGLVKPLINPAKSASQAGSTKALSPKTPPLDHRAESEPGELGITALPRLRVSAFRCMALGLKR